MDTETMERIVVCFTLKSRFGYSIYNIDQLRQISPDNLEKFLPDEENIEKLCHIMVKHGFTVESRTRAGISVSGEKNRVEEYFDVEISKKRIRYIRNYEYYEYIGNREFKLGSELDFVEKAFLQKQFFVLDDKKEIKPYPPELDFYHVEIPDDLRKIARTQKFYEAGFFGRSVKTAIVDTGFFHQHPFYSDKNLRVKVIPAVGWLDASRDERGHGSAMSSVFWSIAPETDLVVVKTSDIFLSYPLTAFQKAVSEKPDIINCSWGTIGFEPQLYLEIYNAVREGRIVLFASGNGSTDRMEGVLQTITAPAIISVGGCYVDENGEIEVSDISSSYESDVFPGRLCPDLCGLCGKLPFSKLILFPTEPGSIFDRKNSERDGTEPDDGWFVSSGTSAATAYASGITALLIDKLKTRDVKEIRQLLFKNCVKVEKGLSFMRERAQSEERNRAVGYGFLTGENIE